MKHFSFCMDWGIKFESICGVYFKHKPSMWHFTCDVEACLTLSSEDAGKHETISWLSCIRQLHLGSVALHGKAWLKPSPPSPSVAVYFDWQLTGMLKESKKVVWDSCQAKHCLIHTTISRKTSCWHRKPQTLWELGVCVCVCSGMQKSAYVGVWLTWWARLKLNKMWIRTGWK